MKKITVIARRVILLVLIAALLWFTVQFLQAPITTISKMFNPFDRMEGRVPHEAANEHGRIEFLLRNGGAGVKMSVPSVYVGSKVQDEMELVWLQFNYETLRPLKIEEWNAQKSVTAIIHPRPYEDAYTRSDFETLQKNDMLTPETEVLWSAKVPKGIKEQNEWEAKYNLKQAFFPSYGGYYYLMNGDLKVSLIKCEKKCSVTVGINDNLRADLSIHRNEIGNIPYITQQVKKIINTVTTETTHAG